MWERLGSILGVLGAFAAAWGYVDTHYASAADLDRLSKEMRLQTYDLRKRQLKATIFPLEFKQNSKRLTDLEQAQLSEAKRELEEIVAQEVAVQKNSK